jgi:hypothetical protein
VITTLFPDTDDDQEAVIDAVIDEERLSQILKSGDDRKQMMVFVLQ